MRLRAPTSKNRLRWRLSAYDMAWVLAAPFIALTLRDPGLLETHAGHGILPASYQFAALAIAFAIPAFLFFRIGDGMSRFFSSQDLWSVIAATLTTVAATSLTLFIINRLDGVPRSTPLIYGLVLAAGLLGGRAVARLLRTDRWINTKERHESHLRRVIIVGVDRFAAVAIKLTDCQQPRTTQVVAALDGRERLSGQNGRGVNIVGRPDDLEQIIEEYLVHGVEIDEVWLTDNTIGPDDDDPDRTTVSPPRRKCSKHFRRAQPDRATGAHFSRTVSRGARPVAECRLFSHQTRFGRGRGDDPHYPVGAARGNCRRVDLSRRRRSRYFLATAHRPSGDESFLCSNSAPTRPPIRRAVIRSPATSVFPSSGTSFVRPVSTKSPNSLTSCAATCR